MKIAKLLLAAGYLLALSQTAQGQGYYETTVQPSSTEANAHTSEIDKTYNERGDRYIPVDFNLQLKNMHLWRGLQVTNTALAAVDLYFKDRQDMFHVGLWGGSRVYRRLSGIRLLHFIPEKRVSGSRVGYIQFLAGRHL